MDVQIASDQGNHRTQYIDVFNSGNTFETINSRGRTSNVEAFNLYTDETEELRLWLCDSK